MKHQVTIRKEGRDLERAVCSCGWEASRPVRPWDVGKQVRAHKKAQEAIARWR